VKKTDASLLLETHMRELGMVCFPEWFFAKPRKWRFDYLVRTPQFIECGVEIEGGGWVGGRHTRGKGFEADLEKYATATAMGYVVFRFSPKMILTGQAKEFLRQWLALKEKT
jgi:hypothetical protein